MSFQIHALAADSFQPLFAMSADELAEVRATRVVADAKPGYPCRVSLADAEIGESLVLVNFEHQPAESPFRSAHAIFVREAAGQAFPGPGEVPDALQSRLISVRAFDDRHYLVNAEVVAGLSLRKTIPEMFREPAVAYLHLHNARQGCYMARVSNLA